MFKTLLANKKIILGSCIALFLALYVLITPHGLGLTNDSHQFLHAGNSLRNLGYLEEIGGGDFVHWPPLFPVILSFFENPVQMMLWLNPFLWCCSVFLWSNVFFDEVEETYFRWFGMILMTVNISNLLLVRFLWVESLFVFLIVS